mgnify:FL=1
MCCIHESNGESVIDNPFNRAPPGRNNVASTPSPQLIQMAVNIPGTFSDEILNALYS